MAETISLYRPRRRGRVIAAVAVAAALTAGTVVAVNVADWVRYNMDGSPRVQASDLLGPADRAQAAVLEETGRYATSRSELLAATPELTYRFQDAELVVRASGAGTAYLVVVRGFDGRYWATVGTTTSTPSHGDGATFEEAAAAAGFTDDWSAEHGFGPTGTMERHYGTMAALPSELVELRDVNGMYTLTRAPYPTTGEGASWAAAVKDAGGDPTLFTVAGEVLSEPVTVTAEDDSAQVRLVADGDMVRARLSVTPVVLTGGVPEDLVAEAGLEDQLEDLHNTYACETQADPAGIESVTLCAAYSGAFWAYSTSGVGPGYALWDQGALEEAGVTEAWLREVRLRAPRADGLL